MPAAPHSDASSDRGRIVSGMLAAPFPRELDAEGAIDLVVASARRALGADRASCYVHAEDGRRVLAVHTTEDDPGLRAAIEGARDRRVDGMPVWRLLASRPDATLVVEDLAVEEAIPAATARALGAGAFIGVRLEHPSVPGDAPARVLGTLFVTFRRPRRLTAPEHSTVQSLAGMASVALAGARPRAGLLCSPVVVEGLSAQDRAERLHRPQALQGIRLLARAIDAKDPATLQHSRRVAELAVSIAAAMGWSSERRARLREAGLVHDVGKIGIRDRILFAPGRLTRAEYREIMRHPEIGADMLGDVLTPEQVAWVRGHHERWDGTGYPDRLAGRAIPDGARVLALADAWDAMTSARSYHEPLTAVEALAECERCAGAQFWGDAVDVLVRLVRSGAAEVSWPRVAQAATEVSLRPSMRRPRRYPA